MDIVDHAFVLIFHLREVIFHCSGLSGHLYAITLASNTFDICFSRPLLPVSTFCYWVLIKRSSRKKKLYNTLGNCVNELVYKKFDLLLQKSDFN